MVLNAVNSQKVGRARLLPSRIPRLSRGKRLGRSLALPSHGIFQRCLAAMLMFLLFFGCEGRPSTAERVEKASKSAKMDPVAVYPLGGKVTIDNALPAAKSGRSHLVVIAYDTTKSDAKANSNAR